MYAVIETGGKQYRVEEGTLLEHELIDGAEVGAPVEFDRVLLLVEDGDVRVGTPYLDGAKVKGEVRERWLDEKVIVYKYKRKKGYRRKQGHRQGYLRTLITAIES
ncbi:MAG: 50S ribosomal protein L21 [Candidatus Bipolaricaulota bacterium]|jgi:large subunit ribosomal protein L21|nr:50S ribosomal protein L21 [Candidatus Bipolaricaulota bacterium]